MSRVLFCLTEAHDWRLVVLAGVVCFLTSLAAISIFHRARATCGLTRAGWVATAGAAAGCGIWATHFIAMLAYEPGIATGYAVGLTMLSLLAAVCITGCGLGVGVYGTHTWSAPAGGGVLGI